MQYARTGIFAGLRRLTGWTVAYAVVLQLLFGAVAGAQFSAQAADQNWSFLEICYGKGAPDGEVPEGKPDRQASKCFACAVCAHALAIAAPDVPAAAPAVLSARVLPWTVRAETIARRDAAFSQRQRAPPFEA